MQLVNLPMREGSAGRPPDQRVDLFNMEKMQVQSGAMTHTDLEDLLRDLEWEPQWRREADTNCAYYDGYQKTPEQQRLEAEGQPVAVVNLISRTVNVMLGNEAKARTSWKLTADQDEFGDVSDAMQVKLTEAQRETYADMSISEAYASQAKAGLGWIEVSRVAELFSPFPYRCKPVHRNEIWWDWRAKELDLSDARYLVRKRWFDLDELEVMMPEFRPLFRYYSGASWKGMSFTEALNSTEVMRQADDVRRAFKIESDEWLDTSRKRIKVFEVWYRVMRPCVAMILQDGTVKEFKPTDPMHAEAVSRGMVKLQRTFKRTLRMALFVGPHRVIDSVTERKNWPYIPFWAFRDDQDRSPYSMVSGMRYPQDEYNARRSRLMWLLQAAQVFADNDALDPTYNNLYDLAKEIMRPDAFVVTNKEARNGKDSIRIQRNTQMPREQSEVMMDAKNLVMEQPGVSATMMGDKTPGVTSGLAFNSLVTQSNIAIGDHDDNYRFGRRLVGEALAELIVEDMSRPNMQVKIGSGRRGRVVVLNTMDQQTGMPVNMVKAAPIKVALDEAPNTQAYKMQQQVQIGTALQAAGNDPIARAVLMPAFIESTDIQGREEYAKWMRQQYGVPQPGDRQEQEQADMQRAQQQQKQAQLQDEAAQAELADKQASAMQKQTAAQLNQARVLEIQTRAAEVAANDPVDDAIAEARQN